MVEMLFKEGARADIVDTYGHTALTLYLSGKKASSLRLYVPALGYDCEKMFSLLMKCGGNLNHVYPEKQFKRAFENNDSLSADQMKVYMEQQYSCTPLINIIRSSGQNM